MLSLILVVAISFIVLYIKKSKEKFSENFFSVFLLFTLLFAGFWGFELSYTCNYDENAEDIKVYEENIRQLELELNEIEILIEDTSLRSDLTEKEIEAILDSISVRKCELSEQIASYNEKLDMAHRYNNPEILKISKFLIYFGWN